MKADTTVIWILAIILTMVPLFFLIFMVGHFSVDIPFLDQWDFLPLLVKTRQGKLTIYDLWAQHNEHRIFFPRLIMIPLALATGWNTRYEMAINIIFAVGIFLSFLFTWKKQSREEKPLPFFILPIVSLIIFSLNQWENWFWGWQMQILMNVFFIVWGIVCLSRSSVTWKHIISAILLGILATFSFATGVVYWLVGSIIIIYKISSKKVSWLVFIVWIAASLVILALYFWSYATPPNPPSRWILVDRPLFFFHYLAVYIGTSLATFSLTIATLTAFFGLSIYIWYFLRLLKNGYGTHPFIIFSLGLALYALFSGFIIAVGRAAFGPMQAASSRYITFSQLFWLACIMLLIFHFSKFNFILLKRIPFMQQKSIDITILSFIVFLNLLSSIFSIKAAVHRYYVLDYIRDNIVLDNSAEDLNHLYAQIYSDPAQMPEKLNILKQYRWSLYRL